MLQPEEHRDLLRTFEVDRLLKLLSIEAKKHRNGHYTLFSFTSGYKAAFGIVDLPYGTGPSKGYQQVASMQQWVTLKEAIIEALVQGKTCTDYFDGDPQQWVDDRVERLYEEDMARRLEWGAWEDDGEFRNWLEGLIHYCYGGEVRETRLLRKAIAQGTEALSPKERLLFLAIMRNHYPGPCTRCGSTEDWWQREPLESVGLCQWCDHQWHKLLAA
jgi:hypothetical protein